MFAVNLAYLKYWKNDPGEIITSVPASAIALSVFLGSIGFDKIDRA